MNNAAGQMEHDLKQADDINAFLKDNDNKFIKLSFREVLNEIFAKKGITKASLAKKSGISEVFVHQIFSGARFPSRNKLICLCVGLDATIEEAARLTHSAGYACLSPQVRRDCIILFGILNNKTIWEINEKLDKENEETIL